MLNTLYQFNDSNIFLNATIFRGVGTDSASGAKAAPILWQNGGMFLGLSTLLDHLAYVEIE